MSSSLSTPSYSATAKSKRLSLNLSNGPRPLHLVDANTPSNTKLGSTPVTPPLFSSTTKDSPKNTPPSSSKVTNGFQTNPRRQSSISYLPRDRTSDKDATVRSPLNSPRYSSTPSNPVSVGPGSSGRLLIAPPDRGNTALEVDGPPLTLAEKHSELLHFIAQKESKCLELRSQLAIHESELLNLKRRWERIISRGFETSNSDSTQSQSGGAVLEGIREGVQGVSRFIAAGLAIGELSPPPTSASSQPDIRRTHTSNHSNSSISTTTTKSTRFSQSSTSSIGEESLLKDEKRDLGPSGEDDNVHVLIVRDTGATPTMSPNPHFVRKQQQHQEQQERAKAFAPSSSHSSFETEPDCFPSGSMHKSTKAHRRKSRNSSNLTFPFDNLVSPMDAVSITPSVDLEREASKRASMNASAFPPVSSIPGLGLLAAAAASPPVVSSWVGSVGKKWEELQCGSGFSKSQKRTSLFLSDISQSIASAITISAPSTPSTAPLYFSPHAASPVIASTTSTSLLDDDVIFISSVMKPDLKAAPAPLPPLLAPTSPKGGTGAAGAQSKVPGEDEEWTGRGISSVLSCSGTRFHANHDQQIRL